MHAYTSLATVSLVGLLAQTCLAVPVEEKILTPGGYRIPGNVYQIPSGGSVVHVGGEIHGLSANGTIVNMARPPAAADTSLVAREQTGWITYAMWSNLASSPITSFSTTFTVPPVPESHHGQTVFLWNGLQPVSPGPATILQPVLQYGPSDAGGGEFWSVASWYIVGNSVFFTDPAPVNPGDVLTGIITLSQNGTSYNYNSRFIGIIESAVDVIGTEPLGFATVTLEGYSVTEASDYPAGSTVFSNTSLELQGGVVPDVSWTHVDDVADGITTTIDKDGATSAEITITY